MPERNTSRTLTARARRQGAKDRPGARSQLPAADILESMPQGVLVLDGAGKIHFRNVAAARWIDPRIDDVSKAFPGGPLGDNTTDWPGLLSAVLSTKEPTVVLGAVPRHTTESKPLLVLRLAPLKAARSRQPKQVVLVIDEPPTTSPHDVPGVSRRLLSLGKLASRVAHELNNPLDGILRYINLALRIVAESPEPRLKSYLSHSQAGLTRMVQIIGDLLEFSRSSASDTSLTPINEVIEAAIGESVASADAARVMLAVDFQTARMPQTQGPRLFQVCCNLIRNAIDAMPDGGRLSIVSGIVEDQVLILVEDTGVGLPHPPEKVFEPFYTTKPPGKGTGLGLAICKEFIEEMHGSIAAKTADQGGATFTVRIPLASLHQPREVSIAPFPRKES